MASHLCLPPCRLLLRVTGDYFACYAQFVFSRSKP
jgi:hypothetical protein